MKKWRRRENACLTRIGGAWIAKLPDNGKVQCNMCATDLSISCGGRTDVRRHQQSARHAELAKSKAGFILRTKIYAVYADHFAHVGRVFSATNADLRRSHRADGKYKHSGLGPIAYVVHGQNEVDGVTRVEPMFVYWIAHHNFPTCRT